MLPIIATRSNTWGEKCRQVTCFLIYLKPTASACCLKFFFFSLLYEKSSQRHLHLCVCEFYIYVILHGYKYIYIIIRLYVWFCQIFILFFVGDSLPSSLKSSCFYARSFFPLSNPFLLFFGFATLRSINLSFSFLSSVPRNLPNF